MQDWIVGLMKAASSSGPGAGAADVEAVAKSLGTPVPAEVRALYAQLNGATFRSGVMLFPLSGINSIETRSAEHLPGFADAGVWRLGQRGEKRQLFAAQKSAIPPSALQELPSYWDRLEDAAFVFGIKNDETGEVRIYRTLEQMLSVMVPPVETEEFGERTYARAMSLVQGALDTLKQGAERAVGEANTEVVTELATRAARSVRKVAETIQRVRAINRKAKPAAKKKKTKSAAAAGARGGGKAKSAKATASRKAAPKKTKSGAASRKKTAQSKPSKARAKTGKKSAAKRRR